MSTAELAAHNVVAAFRDLELATDAIGALREAGFDDAELSVLGRTPDELEVVSEDEMGEPLPGGLFRHVALGGLSGTAIGAILGALGGAAIAAIPGVGLVAGTGAILGALGGGGAGGTVGAIIEGESTLRTDASWSQTFDAIKAGAVVVGVHHDSDERIREAEAILRRLEPMDVARVNDRGERISASDR